MRNLNNQFRLTYSFSTTQLKWRRVTISQGTAPLRKRLMGAVTDNNDKIYIFGGGFVEVNFPEKYYSNGMDIFDTINLSWKAGSLTGAPRTGHGHTATLVGEIIYYIGGLQLDAAGQVFDPLSNVCIKLIINFKN
mgnify:CR=1 FL=1